MRATSTHFVWCLPWLAVVIYPQRSLDPNDRLPYKLLLNSSQVQRIYLDELDTGENSLQVAIVKLIIEREETAVDKSRELILQARQQLADETTTKQIVELIETILLYKFTRLSREELAEMLSIDKIILQVANWFLRLSVTCICSHCLILF